MNKKILGGIIIGASLLYYTVWRGIKAIKVAFAGLERTGTTTGGIGLRLKLAITNPLWVGLTIDSIKGTVYLQDVECATVDTAEQTIAARATSVFNIDFVASAGSTLEALLANIESGDVQTLTVRFKGEIEKGSIKIPVDYTATYSELFGE